MTVHEHLMEGFPTERMMREGTKQVLVIEMLRRPEGGSLAEIAETANWTS